MWCTRWLGRIPTRPPAEPGLKEVRALWTSSTHATMGVCMSSVSAVREIKIFRSRSMLLLIARSNTLGWCKQSCSTFNISIRELGWNASLQPQIALWSWTFTMLVTKNYTHRELILWTKENCIQRSNKHHGKFFPDCKKKNIFLNFNL